MLAKTPKSVCLECGLPFGAAGFSYDHDDPDLGPAYWSDRGLLCSPGCAGDHYRKRMAEGTMPAAPMDCPVEWWRD